MKYAMRTNESSQEYMFIMHAAGCKDISRDGNRHGGYVQEFDSSLSTPESVATEWLEKSGYAGPDSEYESPWTVEHVKILPCCRKAQP